MNKKTNLSIAILALAIFSLAACAPKTTGNAQATPAAVNTNEGKGEEGGVEAALVTYSDSAQGFSIGHPGTWTQDTAVSSGVKYVGGDDWMQLTFVNPPQGMDAMSYAQNDINNVSSAFPGFKQINLAASTEVNGAVVLGFTADGTSAVTGKAFTEHNEIYYIPLADGRLAVLTVVGPENYYDREGVRDIALTLNGTK